jgi:hypothetical protein
MGGNYSFAAPLEAPSRVIRTVGTSFARETCGLKAALPSEAEKARAAA